MAPMDFLSDMRIIRELTSLLARIYPDGISFKLDKETHGFRDKDKIIRDLKEQNEALLHMLTMEKKGELENVFKSGWRELRANARAHNKFAETYNNYFAETLSKNGFHCRSNGLIEPELNEKRNNAWFKLLKKHAKYLIKSGFL
jgi:hypothetical protein